MIATYQTRISNYQGTCRGGGDVALAAYAELYGRVQRKLFADVSAGRSSTGRKNVYLRRYRIPARMFNSIRMSLEGKVKAVRESMALRRRGLELRIAAVRKQVAGAISDGRWQGAHEKRRKVRRLELHLSSLDVDIADGRVRLCFGSKKLWRSQFDLEANGYSSHEDWLVDWQESRSNEFFVMGSKDERAGCQLCVATVADDGSFTLRLRLPDALAEEYGKYVVMENVQFAYGHEQVLAALLCNAKGSDCSGQPVSYRFKKDAKGWRIFVSTKMMDVPATTDSRLGAIGVDLNSDHLAVAETDSSGNCVNSFRVLLATYGKSQRQAEALIGDAVARVVEYAKAAGKPIVIEKLDFGKKKSVLEGESRKYSRMLSSFSYGKVRACFISRGYRQGVEIHQVNPAFSSVIGRVKFMERYGLSVHQAAALVLARRLLGCSERIPLRQGAPVGNGVHVAFTVPARKRVKHVWTYWGAVLGQLRPALAAQHRLGKRRRRPNPVRAGPRAVARGLA